MCAVDVTLKKIEREKGGGHYENQSTTVTVKRLKVCPIELLMFGKNRFVKLQ